MALDYRAPQELFSGQGRGFLKTVGGARSPKRATRLFFEDFPIILAIFKPSQLKYKHGTKLNYLLGKFTRKSEWVGSLHPDI